jgi:hypothetical protein
MKKIALLALLLLLPSLVQAQTKYPPGASASAIAIDQEVKYYLAKHFVNYCMFIDTATGQCDLWGDPNISGGGT